MGMRTTAVEVASNAVCPSALVRTILTVKGGHLVSATAKAEIPVIGALIEAERTARAAGRNGQLVDGDRVGCKRAAPCLKRGHLKGDGLRGAMGSSFMACSVYAEIVCCVLAIVASIVRAGRHPSRREDDGQSSDVIGLVMVIGVAVLLAISTAG